MRLIDRKIGHNPVRRAIMFGGVSALLTGHAQARPRPLIRLPASILYLKLDAHGSAHPDTTERRIWDQFAMGLGGLISRIEPVPVNRLMQDDLNAQAGSGAAILSARMAAQRAGYDYIIVYGVLPDAETYESQRENSVTRKMMKGVRRRLTFWKHDADEISYKPFETQNAEEVPAYSPLFGEAHLIDVRGGQPLASSWADAQKRHLIERWTSKDRRDEEIIAELADSMQRKIQELSERNFVYGRSIAD